MADPQQSVSEVLLTEFRGQLVDRKVTYATSLKAGATQTAATTSLHVGEHPRGPASRELLDLGLAAGWNSRYQVDPRIPRDRFIALYETWMDRSTRGELADAVLVAQDASTQIAGVVTISLAQQTASIGLIAVHERCRGQGVGQQLMTEAHRWMREHGASEATVVTQLDNAGACKLYERSGYQIRDVKHVYHFWVKDRA
jgi:dTDP-4-amino-4,6-dideoxy-D-galactose acyltransferase